MWTLTYCRIIIFLSVVLGNNVHAQYEGNRCTHTVKGFPGICKKLDQCPTAIQDLRKGIFPQNCGFVGIAPIVCCPLETTITTITATKTTATTTTTTKRPTTSKLPVGEKCKRACQNYKSLAFKKEESPSLLPDYDYYLVENCPWDSQSLSTIYDGPASAEAEFPHMALLGYGTWPDNYGWKCSGSLISETYVLTAAHCLFAREFGEPKFVRLGDLDYSTTKDDKYMQQINIKKIIKHPLYKFPVKYHDIALLELEKAAQLNLHVKPVCLYTKEASKNVRSGIITGWGVTERTQASSKLLKVVIQYFTTEICNETFGNDILTLPRGIDPELQICFGPYKNETDTCQADSGGPIQIYNNEVYCSYYIFGITSFRKSCSLEQKPTGYVNLYKYIEWIEDTVWP